MPDRILARAVLPAEVMGWLLAGDAAVRWQVMRDLQEAPEAECRAERDLVAARGWGARLLGEQGEDGRWAGGFYGPKWVSTHYTLLLLRSLGLPPANEQALRGAALLLAAGLQPDGGIHFASRQPEHSETCITGMSLAICAYFLPRDDRLQGLVDHLLRVQLPDGGWNCQWVRGSVHGSFHTTICVLEGLREYAVLNAGSASAVAAGEQRGREFLLRHRLFRSHRTGAVVHTALTRFSFPPQWHYDVLRGLDHFRAAGAPRDERLGDAIDLVLRRQRRDGRWLLQNRHPGRLWFEMEEPGDPSRWNTLRALRVLRWWQGHAAPAPALP